jgi:uncharacterized membrane protein
VGSRTGRPTPIGWYYHEIQWRGENQGNRQRFDALRATVDAVYNATTAEELMSALDELDAHYVVVGSPERSRYPSASMATMERALDIVFEFGDVRVFAVPVHSVMSTS